MDDIEKRLKNFDKMLEEYAKEFRKYTPENAEKFRKFYDDKTYKPYGVSYSKEVAISEAEKIRKQGYLARIAHNKKFNDYIVYIKRK